MEYGLQLYSVRDAAGENYAATLKAVAKMGYSFVESAGFYGHSADEVKAMLDEAGLSIIATHTGWGDVIDRLDETIAYHKALGCKHIVIPGAPLGTKAEVDFAVDAINRIQPIVEAAGLLLHYHNHSGEFLMNRDGVMAEYELYARTNILFEIDTFWAYHAGVDPVGLMEEWRDRIALIHLKDGFSENGRAIGKSLGLGAAPVLAVREKAMALGIQMIVESEGLEPTGLEEVKRCIEFLNTLA